MSAGQGAGTSAALAGWRGRLPWSRPAPGAGAGRRRDGGRMLAVLLFLPPALLLFTLFVVLPVVEAGWYSGFNWNGFGAPTRWVGLANYRAVFASHAFWLALRDNALVIAVSILVQLPLAMALALALAGRMRGALALRLLFFLPYVLAEIAAGLIFSFVYDGEYGLLAGIWRAFGATATPQLLASPHTAMAAVLVVVVWKYFGFHMMLFIAALQGLDQSQVEAARLDGATRAQVLRFVTLPSLLPTIRLSVFFAIVGSLQLFDVVMPLTGGGPEDSSQTLVTFLYNFGVTRMRVGFGSAVGVVLFVICASFAFGYQRLVLRDE